MSSLKVEPLTGDLHARCQKYKLRMDLAGGILKKGMEVFTLHHFRIYVPLKILLEAHHENSSLTIEMNGRHLHPAEIENNEAATLAASFEIDGQLFDRQFECVLPKGVSNPSEPLIVPIQ